MSAIRLGARSVGRGHACYVIAEAGVNHDGDPDAAIALVHAAVESGADAVKFQLFRAVDVASPDAPKAQYQLEATDPSETQVAMLEKLELPEAVLAHVARESARAGIDFLCTAYSEDGLDMLENLGVPAFKIASAQIIELPLIARAAAKGRPLLISTGMATLTEIDEALETVRAAGNAPVVLLQCTTDYPSSLDEANLRTIASLSKRYGLPIGYSDHSVGDVAAPAAVACGAVVIEKHLTLDRSRPGPDHASSMEPEELARLIVRIRETEKTLGSNIKSPTAREVANAVAMRRSIFTTEAVAAGATIQAHQVALRRPASGLPPRELERVVGARAAVDIPANTPVTPDLVES